MVCILFRRNRRLECLGPMCMCRRRNATQQGSSHRPWGACVTVHGQHPRTRTLLTLTHCRAIQARHTADLTAAPPADALLKCSIHHSSSAKVQRAAHPHSPLRPLCAARCSPRTPPRHQTAAHRPHSLCPLCHLRAARHSPRTRPHRQTSARCGLPAAQSPPKPWHSPRPATGRWRPGQAPAGGQRLADKQACDVGAHVRAGARNCCAPLAAGAALRASAPRPKGPPNALHCCTSGRLQALCFSLERAVRTCRCTQPRGMAATKGGTSTLPRSLRGTCE